MTAQVAVERVLTRLYSPCCTENIILDERGWPHLADFGVAFVHHPEDKENRYGDTLTCTLASGTKQYLGPEVFGKEHIHGPEADFWSLAVVAYELLFPKRPFEKHCNIEFITYLERALAKQRKLSREARVREVQNSGLRTEFEESGGGCADSPFRPTSSSAFSPDRCSQARASPSISASTSRESNTAFFPGVGVVSRTGSFDLSAQEGGSAPTPGFCSSVQYTANNTSSQGLATNRSASGNTSGASSQSSSRGSTPVGSEMDLGGSQELQRGSAMHRSCDRLEGILCGAGAVSPAGVVRPSTVATGGLRGISFDGGDQGNGTSGSVQHLPPLGFQHSESGSTTPPKQSKLPRQGAFLPPASGGSGSPVKALLQQQAALHQHFSCHQRNPVAEEPAAFPQSQGKMKRVPSGGDPNRLPYGNHWAVDEEPTLPHGLRVHIPSTTSWGKLTPECVSYLKAAFDIRPSHRLSSRNIDAIRTHPWLQSHGLSDWQELYSRNYAPNFKPGKRFMREIFADPTCTVLPGAGNALHDPDGSTSADNYFEARRQQEGDSGESAATLTAEQLAIFRGFRYTSPALQGLFVNKEPDLPCQHTSSGTTSAEAVTAGSSSKMTC